MTDDNGPRLRDIVVLLLLALLVRLIEWYDIDAAHGWRVDVDADALERREGRK